MAGIALKGQHDLVSMMPPPSGVLERKVFLKTERRAATATAVTSVLLPTKIVLGHNLQTTFCMDSIIIRILCLITNTTLQRNFIQEMQEGVYKFLSLSKEVVRKVGTSFFLYLRR